MSIWLVITRKELLDAIRDRRALMALLLFPVIGPFVIYFMFNTIVDIAEEAKDLTLPIVGAEYAPDLVDFLEQSGIKLTPIVNEYETSSEARNSKPSYILLACWRTSVKRSRTEPMTSFC